MELFLFSIYTQMEHTSSIVRMSLYSYTRTSLRIKKVEEIVNNLGLIMW